jgi:hypothetical protein
MLRLGTVHTPGGEARAATESPSADHAVPCTTGNVKSGASSPGDTGRRDCAAFILEFLDARAHVDLAYGKRAVGIHSADK